MRLAPGLALGLMLAASAATAAPPVLNGVSPRGVQRGRSATLTLTGPGVGLAGPELYCGLPGTVGPLKVDGPNKISVEVDLPADAAVGYYPLQVRTADGLTGRELVAVGDLPEATEREPNDEPGAAQDLGSLPLVVQGACAGTDRDHFRFAGKKGQALVIEVEARRLGSGLDPTLEILDQAGHQLAADAEAALLGGDPRLVFTPPEDGTYLIELNDLKYAGAGGPFYRLKVGPFTCADAVFPLGWRRGESVQVQFLGGNLAEPVRSEIRTPADPGLAWTTLTLPGASAGASPFRFALGDAPEQIEPDGTDAHPWSVGVVMNGRIAEPGEVDRYKLAVRPGQAIALELDAARLGSRLDAVLKVALPDGSVLAETDDSRGFDPSLTITAGANLSELVVGVEDLLGRGGPAFAYRLTARPSAVDYTLQVASAAITIPKGATAIVPVRVARQNFNGAIQLSIPADLPGVSASGGLIPAGAAEGSLVLTAAADSESRPIPLEIWGEGGPPAQPIRRRALLAADGTPTGPSRPDHLVAAVGNGPPVTLEASAASLALVLGREAKLTIKANRPPGHKEPIAITTAGLPPQAGGLKAAIGGDQAETTIQFSGNPLIPVGPKTLQVTARTRVDGRDETIVLPPVAVEVVQPFSLEILTPDPTLTAGGKATILGLVRRVPPFDEVVTVSAEGSLPAQVAIAPATVAKGESLVRLEVTAGPEARPDAFDVPLRGAADIAGRKQTKDYVIPDVAVRVTVTSAAAPPVASK